MNDNKPTELRVLQVDARAGYRRDECYPNWIFLATVLRWSVTGNVVLGGKRPGSDAIVRHNDSALDSTAAFLADHIESGKIPIFNAHARISLGSAEKRSVISKLRGLDGGTVGGLVDDAGLNYYIGGRQLFSIIKDDALPSDDDSEKGGVWYRLMFDAPPAWWQPASTESPENAALPVPVVTDATLPDEVPAFDDSAISALFDAVKSAQLEAMFPDSGKWANYTERAARNGLKEAAKDSKALFNPYRAAVWWLTTGPEGWDWARCLRKLANNMPARSIDSKHLLTGDYE